MKRTVFPIVALALLLLAAPPVRAKGSKAKVLAKIESLLDTGDTDTAKQMIDFFLGKNPGDPDLLALQDRWRIQTGDLSSFFSEKDLAEPAHRKELRAACFRVVKATISGNPDEWHALLFTGEPRKVRILLEKERSDGTPEDVRAAGKLLAELTKKAAKPPRDVPPDRVLVALRSSDPDQVLWGLWVAEKKKVKETKGDALRLFHSADQPEVKYGAAAVLLALGDETIRPELVKALHATMPVDAVEAGKALFRHPGKGPKALETMLAKIEKDDGIGRARPTLLSLGVMALARRKEPGTRAFLVARLDKPDIRVDAARALGVLGDRKAVPALFKYLKEPPPAREAATGGGLGYLSGAGGGHLAAAKAAALRPALVGALAILRLTAPPPSPK